MNTVQIEKICSKAIGENLFRGVFSCDKLPVDCLPKPSCIVVNTQSSSEAGEHWIGMYINSDGSMDFFDSYGNMPEKYPQFKTFLKVNGGTNVRWNDKVIQGIGSLSCGQYVIFFNLHRSKDISMHRITNFFGANKTDNDCYVTHWLNKRFKMDTDCHLSILNVQKCIKKNE